jgi:hypothetical protein
MADNINPMRNPDLKPERDDMENQGAANRQEVIEAEEDDELDDEIDKD